MRQLPLYGKNGSGKYVLVDDDDYAALGRYKWSYLYSNSGYGYAVRGQKIDGKRKTILMHRQILGFGPQDPRIDHWDGNGLNNCRSNLRPCTQSQNLMNRRKARIFNGVRPTSRFKGVCWDKNKDKWMAKIQIGGKTVNLGRFLTEEEAARAYNDRARAAFGEYYRFATLEGEAQ